MPERLPSGYDDLQLAEGHLNISYMSYAELAATLISITLGVGIDYQNNDQELSLFRRSGGG
jgi:hypothetical protein